MVLRLTSSGAGCLAVTAHDGPLVGADVAPSARMARVHDRDGYLDRWAETHGGYDPRGSRVVRGWLGMVHALARPLAGARVPPYLLTALGVLLAVGALPPAAAGGPWLALAAALVALSGLLDSLDGAVAVLTGKASRAGFVLDSVADRGSDAANVGALWLAGADPLVCVAGGGLAFLAEYVRARAGQAGLSEVGVVTVGERATRVAVAAAFLLAGAVLGSPWPALGGWAWLAVAATSALQLLVVTTRRLR